VLLEEKSTRIEYFYEGAGRRRLAKPPQAGSVPYGLLEFGAEFAVGFCQVFWEDAGFA